MNDQSQPENSKMQNIVLIGFMGSGKSTIGREIHKNLGYHLVDTDHLIEEREGMSIPEIFEKKGEAAFREMETDILRQMIHQKTNHHIISTGGGMPANPENQVILKQLGFVIWLSCSVEDIYRRTSRSANRPLLDCNDPQAVIRKLLNKRAPIYKEASHIKINTSKLDYNEILCGILESAQYYFGTVQQTAT